MTASEIYDKILAHQITWAHFVWKPGQADWRRICDTKAFQGAVPHEPNKAVQREIKQTAQPATLTQRKAPVETAEKKAWYLYLQESQWGPFSQQEVLHLLKIGKVNTQSFAWKEGMKNWEPLQNVATFQSAMVAEKPKKNNQRSHPRRPLVAKILMSDEQSVILGVCRDISVGGLQVLTEEVPGEVGVKLKMNISPSSNEVGKKVEAFVAEGTIVRILEDGRGFSFRFERLPESSRKAIEAYIESPF